jgi:regulator of cell morphogenesis and NO signaling
MNSTKQTIGSIAAADYRTADIFKKYGIDFCCNGNRTIEEACKSAGIAATQLNYELQELSNGTTEDKASNDFKFWRIDLLADYIEKKHHQYVTDHIVVLQPYLAKITAVHGSSHPELHEIKRLFDECAEELTAHMRKEEMILFPLIRKMATITSKRDAGMPDDLPGTVENPIRMMMHEHDAEGVRFRKIAALSNNYETPPDGCNTYSLTYRLLKEFENDLHLHIHIENNILFPAAIEMEDAMKSSTEPELSEATPFL